MASIFFGLIILISLGSSAAVRVQIKRQNGQEKILWAEKSSGLVKGKKLFRKIPYFLDSGRDDVNTVFEEYEISDQQAPLVVKNYLKSPKSIRQFENAEVREIVLQGPTENRINLTILGDGYT